MNEKKFTNFWAHRISRWSKVSYKAGLAAIAAVLWMALPVKSDAQQSMEDDALFIRKIYDQTLTDCSAYDWLAFLCKKIGGRLAGSPQASAAVEYTGQMLDTLGLDAVWKQPCTVPHWVRGDKERVRVVSSFKLGSFDLRTTTLGNSVPTPEGGLVAEVVEVQSLDEVDRLGEEGVSGKIVFFNRPMNPKEINTFSAYGGAVDQRGSGPSRAAKYGAVGALVRSMTTEIDDHPHTGSLGYSPDFPKIPAMAVSTRDAEKLSDLLADGPVRVFMETNCNSFDPKPSFNVIGEIKGSEHPEQIIVIGGHLDSWETGEGAHDDGAGCVQSMAVLQTLMRLGYKPKRTIRCVLFMNEENGLAGGRAYGAAANEKGEFHMAAIESDRGGFTPRGFTFDADESVFAEKFKKVYTWQPLLEPYGLSLSKGGSGADIGPLKSQKGLLIGFYPDSQRYFDYHHTETDRLEAVNKRELELGAASMTALVYLLDKYGLDR